MFFTLFIFISFFPAGELEPLDGIGLSHLVFLSPVLLKWISYIPYMFGWINCICKVSTTHLWKIIYFISLLIGLLIWLMGSIYWMQINLDEFTDLCNAIALKFQKEDTVSKKIVFHKWKFLIICKKLEWWKLLYCSLTMCSCCSHPALSTVHISIIQTYLKSWRPLFVAPCLDT